MFCSRTAPKFFLGLIMLASGILFRIWIASLLFAIAPYWAIGIGSTFYFIHVTGKEFIANKPRPFDKENYFSVYKATGHSWESLLYSYTTLLFPSGFTKNQGDIPKHPGIQIVSINSAGHSVSEVKRARINQESLLKRTRICLLMFNVLSVMLLIAYSALVETHLFSHTYK